MAPEFIELKPNVEGMFRWIAHVYGTDAPLARNIFFAGWPKLTEKEFQDVITGNYVFTSEDTVTFKS